MGMVFINYLKFLDPVLSYSKLAVKLYMLKYNFTDNLCNKTECINRRLFDVFIVIS